MQLTRPMRERGCGVTTAHPSHYRTLTGLQVNICIDGINPYICANSNKHFPASFPSIILNILVNQLLPVYINI